MGDAKAVVNRATGRRVATFMGCVMIAGWGASRAQAQDSSEWASTVIDYSTQYSTPDWSAEQALGPPDTADYGDYATAWAPEPENGTLEFLTLGFATPVFATDVLVRETYGNGFVYQIDVRDTGGGLHTVWSGVDPSAPGAPADFLVSFPRTAFLVQGVKFYVDTDHNPAAWEEIDAVQLRGFTGTGFGCGACGSLGAVSFPVVLIGYAVWLIRPRR